METSKPERMAWWILGVVAVVLVVVLVLNLWPPPQMGPDPAVFATVDALYTAVRNQDARQLAACEGRLRGLSESGKLPRAASAYLESVIATARGGGWASAAKRLYDFMLAQQREGAGDLVEKKPKASTGKGS